MSSQSPNLSPHGSYREFYPRQSEAFSYRPGQFIKHPFEPNFHSHSPSFISEPNAFKTSIVGNTSTHADQFYKSQVIERGIGGQPVYLNAINNYVPGTGADDKIVMDQIRQEHIKIMDNKLKEALDTNGNNAYQQVKTIILEPITDVVELNVSTVQEGYPGLARRSSIVSTTGIISPPSGRVSTLSIGGLINKRASQVHGVSRVQYVPYQRKVTQLETRQIHEKVPVQKRIIQYEDRIRIQQVPVEKSVIDYYAVQHLTNYEPQIVQQKMTEIIPYQRTIQKTNFIPVQQKILHHPAHNALRGSIVRIQQSNPTIIQSNPLRGSIITYKSPPVVRANSIIGRNSNISPNKILARNSSEMINLASITSLSNNIQRPVSPPRHEVHRGNIINKGFQYTRLVEEPVTYVHNAHILPFTNQLHQMNVIHQEPIIRHNPMTTRTVYPLSSQVQTVHQLPPHRYNQVNYQRPQEVIYEQNTLRRNLSTGIFKNY